MTIDKTCYSVFGVSDVEKSNFVLKLENADLQQVECSKYLGVFIHSIDSNLTWQQHVDYIYNKIVKFAGIFIRYAIN